MLTALFPLYASAGFSANYANEKEQATDSIASDEKQTQKVHELQELVVESKHAWVEGNKVVYIPRKSEKNLAVDAASLIKNLNSGVLYVRNDVIKARGDNPVSIFINGRPASDADLSTFWPQNALRVEYIEDSTDPRFMGAAYAVNFIMKEYTYGGVTKVNGRQTIPNRGKYSLASKFVYKDMTYTANVSGGYDRDHRSSTSNTKTYRDIYYGGTRYDEISRNELSGASATRNNKFQAAVNAYYNRKDRTYISHTLLYSWNQNPNSFSSGKMYYFPDIIDGDSYHTTSNSRSNSIGVGGMYHFFCGEKRNMFQINWAYRHAKNHFYSSYEENGASTFDNSSSETLNLGVLSLFAYFKLGTKCGVSGQLYCEPSWYDTHYSGTYTEPQQMFNGLYRATAAFEWNPNKRFVFTISPQVEWLHRELDHADKFDYLRPGVNGMIRYRPTYKNSISFRVSYFSDQPGPSYVNSAMIRQTELEWLKGNPDLDVARTFFFSVDDFWMPLSNLSIYGSVSMRMFLDQVAYDFIPGGVTNDGLIKYYYNASPKGTFYPSLGVNYSLFRGKLKFSLTEDYLYMYCRGQYKGNRSHWRTSADVAYTVGNCRFSLGYSQGELVLDNGGLTTRRTSDELDFSITYGNGPFYVSLTGANLLHKYDLTKVETASRYFTETARNYSTGRSLRIALTYTFDYGKKVSPRIDSYEMSSFSTSVLGQ